MDDTNGHTCEYSIHSVPLERESLHIVVRDSLTAQVELVPTSIHRCASGKSVQCVCVRELH